MNRETFKELTGEDPEDMFGGDWENEMLGLMGDDDEVERDNSDDDEDLDELDDDPFAEEDPQDER